MGLNLWKPEPKRRSGIVGRMPPVVPGVALSKYTNNELGVRIARRSNQPRQEPGIAWARLMREANRPEKDAAREAVLSVMGVDRFPNLKVLTFPASEWRFEHALLAMRGEREDRGPRRTLIHSIERDIAVYRAACHNIPRSRSATRNAEEIRTPECPAFASAHVQTARVGAFYCCEFEDYAAASCQAYFHAAWLDFNGQLTQRRLSAVESFWNRQVYSLLVVTVLELHQSDWMRARINSHGGTEHLLAACLPGALIESVTRYNDSAPMAQIVLRRDSGSVSPSENRNGEQPNQGKTKNDQQQEPPNSGRYDG